MPPEDMTPENLTRRAVRFYNRYGRELESIRQLLHIQLEQLALAYTLENGLPRKAVQIVSRTKKLKNFLMKLERHGWPEFYLPTEVIHDLIGARVICWFHEDCYGMLDLVNNSKRLTIVPDSLEDYNAHPKPSGYRALHVLVKVSYDQVVQVEGRHQIIDGKMLGEIQFRTMLQDAWGELTHPLYYMVPAQSKNQYNELIAAMAARLFSEDRQAVSIRKLITLNQETRKRVGFKSE